MTSRAGFSVIEALVVLLVGAAALLLIFQVGVQGSQTGLRLGTRALSVVEAEPGVESLRLVIRGLLPDAAVGRLGSTLAGDDRGFTGRIDLDRPTICEEAGPARSLELRLVSTAGGDILTCGRPGAADTETLIDLRPERARFSYSADGERWSSRAADARRGRPGERLFIRLATLGGGLDVVEEAQSFDLGAP